VCSGHCEFLTFKRSFLLSFARLSRVRAILVFDRSFVVIFHFDRTSLKEMHLRSSLESSMRVRVLPAVFPRVMKGVGGVGEGNESKAKWKGNRNSPKRREREWKPSANGIAWQNPRNAVTFIYDLILGSRSRKREREREREREKEKISLPRYGRSRSRFRPSCTPRSSIIDAGRERSSVPRH